MAKVGSQHYLRRDFLLFVEVDSGVTLDLLDFLLPVGGGSQVEGLPYKLFFVVLLGAIHVKQ